jgi:polyisoprenoid-binding protein YceI
MTSFSTPFVNGAGKRTLDENLCKAEALSCEKFPTVTFQSTGIKKTGNNTGDITGNVTLHGVTKPVVLHAIFIGEAPGPGGRFVMGFSATGMLKRSDFDITHAYWNLAVSDEVNFQVEAEFTKTPDDK